MSTDMSGRKVREPGKAGERYREAREIRARKSRQHKEEHWAARIRRARTPLQAFRIMTDRLSTAVIQRERRAVVVADRTARKQPGSRQSHAAQARLEAARREITTDLMWLCEQMEVIAQRHETHRT